MALNSWGFLNVDTHCHFYPDYDLNLFVNSLFQNFGGRDLSLANVQIHEKIKDEKLIKSNCNTLIGAIFLTEGRRDLNSFDKLSTLLVKPSNVSSFTYIFNDEEDFGTLEQDGKKILIFKAKQLVSTEKIEILTLFSNELNELGKNSVSIIEEALAENLPVILPWSPGKWLGARGKLVKEILKSELGEKVFIGDTPLRFLNLFDKKIFSDFAKRTLRGSDPLPFAFEELEAGKFFTKLGPFGLEPTVQALKGAFTSLRFVNELNFPPRDCKYLALKRIYKSLKF
jgi:hypothetical protein